MIVTFYKITDVIIYSAPNAGNEFQLPPNCADSYIMWQDNL